MKIAIPVRGAEGDEVMDSRFGRCERFLFIDKGSEERSSMDNNAKDQGGAGIMAAQIIISNGAEILIAPDIGPKAFNVLNAGGIKVYRSSGGNIEKLLDDLENSRLEISNAPTVKGHHGSY